MTDRRGAEYQAAAQLLAQRVLGALRGAEDTAVVAAHLQAARSAPTADSGTGRMTAAAGAVRMLGADALSPHLLTGQRLGPQEAEAVRVCLKALEPARHSPPAPPAGAEQPWIRAWIDWALLAAVARLDPAGAPDIPPLPGPPPCCDDDAPRRRPAGPAAGNRGEGWVPWSLRMGQLASLALPGLDGPVHQAARRHALALTRGATRAFLRRDFTTAARITRWLAWLTADDSTPEVDLDLLTSDTALRGGDNSRCALDTAITRRLLGLEPT
ncbi:hypothetical protein [Streptomyces sp. WELS2]|uniref:hypothetical protein n=1 Tax=Streptomyces sp. WELS2 TaxID=2749435 RepID=UPI0015F0CB16|nr:hypothetical protein [Streptomyces sp. WELS2]